MASILVPLAFSFVRLQVGRNDDGRRGGGGGGVVRSAACCGAIKSKA